ncbi:MAG: oxidoreductase [bacterium]|nr:oxidoreductase [bacterium]
MSPTPILRMSDVVAGLWRLDSWKQAASATAAWSAACLDAGITTFDLADIYGDHTCEERFGAALAHDTGLRDRMQIVTKCGIRFPSERRPDVVRHHYDSSAEHIVRSVERSLSNLGTDRIDLLLIHRPDFLMDADEVAEAFDGLAREGKVLFFGASNFKPSQFELLSTRVSLVTNQVEASVLHLAPFEDGVFDQCLRTRQRPMAWSPLAGGDLFTSRDERAERVRKALGDVAARHGDASLEAIAFAFLARHPSRPHVITGTRDIDRVRTAAGGYGIELAREEWYGIWTASKGQPLP